MGLCFVVGSFDDWLYNDFCQWREYLKIVQVVWVGVQCGEYMVDVGVLKGIGYLYVEKIEVDILQFLKI